MPLARIIGVVLCAAAVALLAVSVVTACTTYSFYASAERADGVVVDLERRVTEHEVRRHETWVTETMVTFHPVTAFEVDGEEYTFTSSVGTNPPKHEVGDVVVVRFAPGNPHDARLEGMSAYLATIISGGLAVLFGGISWVILRPKDRITKRATRIQDPSRAC